MLKIASLKFFCKNRAQFVMGMIDQNLMLEKWLMFSVSVPSLHFEVWRTHWSSYSHWGHHSETYPSGHVLI